MKATEYLSGTMSHLGCLKKISRLKSIKCLVYEMVKKKWSTKRHAKWDTEKKDYIGGSRRVIGGRNIGLERKGRVSTAVFCGTI